MNKKILLSSFLVMFCVSVTGYSSAFAAVNTYTAEVSFAETVVTITHTPIKLVSEYASQKALVAVGNAECNNADISSVILEYRVSDGAAISSNTFVFANPLRNSDFSLTFEMTAAAMQYRIGASYGAGLIAYQNAGVWNDVELKNNISQDIDVSSAGQTVTLESGNQKYGNTSVVFGQGAFIGLQTIIITELDPANPPVGMSPSKGYSQVSGFAKAPSLGSNMVALYSIEPLDLTLAIPARVTLYYGLTEVTKFELKRWNSLTSVWDAVTSNVTVDSNLKTISADITELGYYAIFAASNITKNDYRPAKRVVIMGRDVFRFNHLKEGDSVGIFNINGKKVKEIKSGDAEGFKWDGRKDNGSWADSGTYIYQIKVNGKLISGTIAFVK